MKKPFLLLLTAMFFTGCSTFNKEWKTALAEPPPTTSISGPWEGRWVSDKNGHTGKVRGILRQTNSEEYDAYFHATFWKIFSASYRVPLTFEEQGERVLLSGEADLGLLSGGAYRYEAEATPSTFFSTYKSKYDHGTFEMKRPTPAE